MVTINYGEGRGAAREGCRRADFRRKAFEDYRSLRQCGTSIRGRRRREAAERLLGSVERENVVASDSAAIKRAMNILYVRREKDA